MFVYSIPHVCRANDKGRSLREIFPQASYSSFCNEAEYCLSCYWPALRPLPSIRFLVRNSYLYLFSQENGSATVSARRGQGTKESYPPTLCTFLSLALRSAGSVCSSLLRTLLLRKTTLHILPTSRVFAHSHDSDGMDVLLNSIRNLLYYRFEQRVPKPSFLYFRKSTCNRKTDRKFAKSLVVRMFFRSYARLSNNGKIKSTFDMTKFRMDVAALMAA